ncbi:MAG TPA: hypothetical protein VF766_12335, partial [Pyrinomonadaceae bacterium]
MTRKSPLIVLLLIFSLFAPFASSLRTGAHAQTRPGPLRIVNKLTDNLRIRARSARNGNRERMRVILNLSDEASKDRARAVLETSGANINQQLDALGVMVADVPV